MPEIILPTLHQGQINAHLARGRFKVLRCGRRWGKTEYLTTVACDAAVKRESVGWFTPEYKQQTEVYEQILDILEVVKRRSSKTEGVIRLVTGGRIDFWTLENPRAGRSRKYHKAILDEVAFAKPNMMDIWAKSIKPTLLDYRGTAIAASTPNGVDPDNFFYKICNDPENKHGFISYHAPSHSNPFLPPEELALLRVQNHPLVFKQEYLAEFVDWSGVQFFSLTAMLDNGVPVPTPQHIDTVFAVIDTAVKTGKDNDGTGVTYYGYSEFHGKPLTILDWDVLQIEGALLETWLPTVFQNLEALCVKTKARNGSQGAFIEDKASGTILIQQALRRGWPAQAIDSKLTALGKDERAISVSGYVYQGLVKITQYAYDKVVQYKGETRNHFLTQVLGFKIGVKDQVDDLLDCFTYGISLALGNGDGY